MRIVWVSAHYNDIIGYSKVTYEILKQMAKVPGFEVFHFGWREHPTFRREPIKGVSAYTGSGQDPKAWNGTCGWGEEKLPKYLSVVKPDLVIFYEEARLIRQLYNVCIPKDRKYQVWVYLDQLYKGNNLSGLETVNRFLIFAEQWRMPVDVPQTVLLHAPSDTIKKLPDVVVRDFRKTLTIPEGEKIYLSINRNSDRKRQDLLVQAWTKYKADGGDGYLVIVSRTLGYYNWNVLFAVENAPMDSIRFVDATNLSDETINKFINVADYGVNTSSGEGFGLMALEMSFLGKPQVALDIGAYRSWLDDETAVLLKPTIRQHMNYNDGGGAFCESTTAEAFALGLRLVQTKRSPKVDFTWDDVVKDTFDIIKKLPTTDMYV